MSFCSAYVDNYLEVILTVLNLHKYSLVYFMCDTLLGDKSKSLVKQVSTEGIRLYNVMMFLVTKRENLSTLNEMHLRLLDAF